MPAHNSHLYQIAPFVMTMFTCLCCKICTYRVIVPDLSEEGELFRVPGCHTQDLVAVVNQSINQSINQSTHHETHWLSLWTDSCSPLVWHSGWSHNNERQQQKNLHGESSLYLRWKWVDGYGPFYRRPLSRRHGYIWGFQREHGSVVIENSYRKLTSVPYHCTTSSGPESPLILADISLIIRFLRIVRICKSCSDYQIVCRVSSQLETGVLTFVITNYYGNRYTVPTGTFLSASTAQATF